LNSSAVRKVPLLLLIFSPFTVRNPWTTTLSGTWNPAPWSTAGQKRRWK